MRLQLVCAWLAMATTGLSAAVYGAMPVPEAPGLSPRYYLGNPPQQEVGIQKRQTGVCSAGLHSCLDIIASVCCPNSDYCYVNPAFLPRCCPIGSLCDSNCPASSYQCSSTVTISQTTTVTQTCCPRACPSTSAYLCPLSLGANCCSYNAACQSGATCSPSSTSSTSQVLTSPAPSSCAATQVVCANSVGGGCCDSSLTCTQLSGSNYCAAPTGSSNSNSSGGGGLSTGVKAGIGAGVAIIALIAALFGILYWHRRSKARTIAASQSRSRSNGSRQQQRQSGAVVSASGTNMSERRKGEKAGRPSLSHSNAQSQTISPYQQRADYFGPDATIGPFTEPADDHHGFGIHGDPGTGVVSTPATSPGDSAVGPNGRRSVPMSPHDIAAPVEIDGTQTHRPKTPPLTWERHKSVTSAEEASELE